MNNLNYLIDGELAKKSGRITFARFMEIALYSPGIGYYAREHHSPVGKVGDFITSVSTGPLFGTILASYLVNLRKELGSPSDYAVYEFGSHRGQLKRDILSAAPDLNYLTIEQNDPMPDSMTGCVLSNELLDAMPVHRVRVETGEWKELYVTRGTDGTLREVTGPLSDPRLAERLAGLPVSLMEGYTTEVNLAMLDWQEKIAARLKRGYVVTIDYGFSREDYYAPHRHEGTLRAYRNHQISSDLLANPGEQDLTAHVEFTSFIEHGIKQGLELVEFTDQGHFLLREGEAQIKEIVERDAGKFSRERSTIHQLIHPQHMGAAFRVLVLRKVG